MSMLRSLQEVYLSHNLLSSIILKNADASMKENDSLISSIRLTILWPHLEVLDLSYNKLNDFYEIMHLLNGGILRRE